MEATIRVLNEMVEEGILDAYAIGGAIAAVFYVEPVATFDLDVFVLLPAAERDQVIVTLERQNQWLARRGHRAAGEHVMIESVPVQLLPAYNPLVSEAVASSVERTVGQAKARVCRPEHLVAILVQTGRPKDRARLQMFLEEAELDRALLERLIDDYGLREKWLAWTA
jgi:hypothetical protein